MNELAPGPWENLEHFSDKKHDAHLIVDAHGNHVCKVWHTEHGATPEERAHAIRREDAIAPMLAATPEMATILHDLAAAAARIVEDDDKPTLEHMRELNRQRRLATEILTKAEGRA